MLAIFVLHVRITGQHLSSTQPTTCRNLYTLEVCSGGLAEVVMHTTAKHSGRQNRPSATIEASNADDSRQAGQ